RGRGPTPDRRASWAGRGRRAPTSWARASHFGGIARDAAGPARHGVLLPLQVAEDRARVDAEVPRRLRPVAVGPLARLQHVPALELLRRLLERHDRRLGAGAEIEVLRAQERPVAEHQRLLDPVLELPDVAWPGVLLDRRQRRRAEAADGAAELVGVLR